MKLKHLFLIFGLVLSLAGHAQTIAGYPQANSLIVTPEENFGKITPQQAPLVFLFNQSGGAFWLLRPNDTKTPASAIIKVHPVSKIRYGKLPITGSGPGGSITLSQISDLSKIWPPKWSDLQGIPDELANAMAYVNSKQGKIHWLNNNSNIGTRGQFNNIKFLGNGVNPSSNGDTLRLDISGQKDYVTPEDYGAYGDSLHNDLIPMQNMFNANKKGTILFKSGKKYRITGKLTITGTGTEDNTFNIIGYGAKIVTTNPDTASTIVFNDCMYATVSGLWVNGTIDYDGWFFSQTQDCRFKKVRTGYINTGAMDEVYWSNWRNCSFRDAIELHVGTSGTPHEFNANSFYQCRLWSGDYAFKVYGNYALQNLNFYSCDISYQTTGRVWIESDLADGQINFWSCYFDTGESMPVNTKNVIINTFGYGNVPNDGNIGSATLNTGSANTVSTSFGQRNAPRSPMSGYNLLTNGDIRYGLNNIVSSFDTTTLVSGTGSFGQYVHFATNSGTLKYAEWTMGLPKGAPYPGWYNITVIGRNVSAATTLLGNVVNGTEVLYINTQKLLSDTAFAVHSFKVKLAQGQAYKFRVYSQISVLNRMDIAYVGLTYGIEGTLGAIEHPLAAFPTADNPTNLFANGDGGVVSSNISTSYGSAAIVSSSGEDQTGDGTYIRYNPSSVGDFPEIKLNLTSKALAQVKRIGWVTFSFRAKIVAGYGATSIDFGAGPVYLVPGTTTTGAWHDWRVTYAVPSGATQVFLRIAMGAAGTTKDLYLDAIQVNPGKTSFPWAPSPYDL